MHRPVETMDLQQARELVGEYKSVLATVSGLLALGAPDSLLPAPPDQLRHAFRSVIQAVAGDELAAPTDASELRGAYVALASFLSYDEAHAAARLQAAFDSGDRGFIASRQAEKTMARARHIEQDAAGLAQEFDGWLTGDHASNDVLAEIDRLLARLDRGFGAARDA